MTGTPPGAEPTRSTRHHWMTWVATHALMRPDDVAFRFLGHDTTWSDLHRRVSALASGLARRRVTAGDRVLLITLNRTEFFETVLAVNALGAIAVPVNFRLTPPEASALAQDCGATAVVTEPALLPLAVAVRGAVPALSLVLVMGAETDGDLLGYEQVLAEGESDGEPADLPDVAEDTTALILYTSGTTGRPKGAMLSHVNLATQALTCLRAFASTEDDIGFMAAPGFHVAALGAVAPNLLLGIRTVIHPLREFSATDILDTWERERVTSVFLVPTQWQAVCADPGVGQRDLALRCISWGAAPASDTLLRQMADTFPDAQNVAVFGQTEMSPITCVLRGEDALRKLGSVGRVIPTVQARVVDSFGQDVPRGEVGEIVYRGPTLMKGYWNAPEATAEAFEGGWFHSGDLVRQDDEGFVWVVDRKKDMLISGGENIYCAEVENAVAAHPDVLEVAVVGRADERWGEVPVAVVALREGAPDLEVEALRAFLRDRLASYKHPRVVERVERLPRNASGKVVKPQLRAQVGS
ncbi:fatty-acid--CoA ligase FadD5 [Lapillicoccus jejuensis]|uniref:Fatty-acyl-CoA synthase n=1 Tax=Lapillicoccus jejuensis TaxID=402171 RepID=A0A542E513_9MICO|nr:fatty-acid--CoA ligase FadD5 [Lapillicoccus jejuensis]TQJ10407.1 fatty-acyl-CoA synthase [Lapillicoccus jejuensis]